MGLRGIGPSGGPFLAFISTNLRSSGNVLVAASPAVQWLLVVVVVVVLVVTIAVMVAMLAVLAVINPGSLGGVIIYSAPAIVGSGLCNFAE